MPAYNAERYIAKAIESVLAQTYEDFELMILDDGSDDDTLTIARRFESLDSRVHVSFHENIGPAATLNRGLALATSEWVVLMHADDEMLPNRIESQLAFITEHPELAVASSRVIHIDANGREFARDHSKLTTHAAVQKLVAADEVIAISHPAAILRKDIVLAAGGYRDQFRTNEDVDLWNRLLEQGHKILVQPEYLLRYRIHGTSATVGKNKLCWQQLRWCKDCMLRRRKGKPELSWGEFVAFRKTLPWRIRVNQDRKDYAKIFYKNATFEYARRHYFGAVANAFLGVMLRPGMILPQITTKLLAQRRASASKAMSKSLNI